ncbi:MAG: VanZ family protein [Anaerolineales bacterium]|nr:VanZ family protein [Anaerolineales bacterium]
MKYVAAVFFVFIIAVIVLADNGSLPLSIRALYDFPNGDKVGHFILFGLLNFFLTRAFLSSFPSKSRGWVTVSIGLILALLIALEEFSQYFFSTRAFDLLDLLASYAGIVAFAFLAICCGRSRKIAP